METIEVGRYADTSGGFAGWISPTKTDETGSPAWVIFVTNEGAPQLWDRATGDVK